MTIEQVYEKRDEILRIAAKHGARNIRIFGSVARGDANSDSDIDLLVEVGPKMSSWFPAGLILDLKELLVRFRALAIAQDSQCLRSVWVCDKNMARFLSLGGQAQTR